MGRASSKRGTSSSLFVRGSALAAASAGVLFVVWGYVHDGGMPSYFDPVIKALASIVPVLFFLGLAGLYARYEGWVGWLAGTGFVLAFLGSLWGAALGLEDYSFFYGYVIGHGWPPLFLNWLPWLLMGLTLVVVTRARMPHGYGGLLFMMVVSGWIYYLTSLAGNLPGVRLGHILFGLLFSLSWVALGRALWSDRAQREPHI